MQHLCLRWLPRTIDEMACQAILTSLIEGAKAAINYWGNHLGVDTHDLIFNMKYAEGCHHGYGGVRGLINIIVRNVII